MNNLEASQRGLDHCHLTSFVWKMIRTSLEKKLNRPLDGWSGPKITTQSCEYKLDWHAPDQKFSEEYLTLYEDGVWEFYGKDGEIEGKILPLHDRRWSNRLTKNKIPAIIAYCSVDFFKELRKR